MSGLLNVATRALVANQTVLQTTGNNIANVNTAGYSRQSAVLQTIPGQFSGSGYIGKGVEVSTIQRNYSTFLTRQSTLAGSVSAGDTARAEKLGQLEHLFPGGANALGATVSNMLNAFVDVIRSPTDLTARTVALTRVNETATRMNNTAASLDELQAGVTLELSQKITAVNALTTNIAKVNEQIARTQGSSQPPNDLLDRRDQLIRDLDQYIQTSPVEATDGTIGLFIGGSQALVLGTTAATLKLTTDDFGDAQSTKLAIVNSGQSVTLDENRLGGGQLSGLLRFQNTDLADARNLLGRYSAAVATSMNQQQAMGLDLNGNAGQNLFTPADFSHSVMEPSGSATRNTGVFANNFILAPAQPDGFTAFQASDYDINFATGSTGTITRRSDGVQTAFDFATSASGTSITFDGLTLTSVDDATAALPIAQAPSAASGDRLAIKPFSTSVSNIKAEFSAPRALAAASPIAGKMGTTNTGSLLFASLTTRTNPPLVEAAATPVVLTFDGIGGYTRSDEIPPNTTTFTYLSGQAIEGTTPATSPLSEWTLMLQGAPKAGDTFTVVGVKDAANNNGIDFKLNASNAQAMMNLRDMAMFDGSVMTDGYADLIAEIGVRTQSANHTAEVSSALADTLENDRTSVSGVNLDEEAAKLLQFQQAYQASAKVIQIAQGIFDTLIQTISR